MSQRPLPDNTQHSQETDILTDTHALDRAVTGIGNFILYSLIYPSFVYYLPEDGHMVGQNTGHCVYELTSIYLCAYVGTTTVYSFM